MKILSHTYKMFIFACQVAIAGVVHWVKKPNPWILACSQESCFHSVGRNRSHNRWRHMHTLYLFRHSFHLLIWSRQWEATQTLSFDSPEIYFSLTHLRIPTWLVFCLPSSVPQLSSSWIICSSLFCICSV